jgi:lipoate---protein ligase
VTATGWVVERSVGPASAFHRALPEPPGRRVWVLEVDRPALVLGSAQADADADAEAVAAAGVELVRRRSGGGAVLLTPGSTVWVDVLLPPTDPCWDDDVGRASHWLGDAWGAALGDVGVEATAHHGELRHGAWSRRVCFAGLGPGEVTVEGRKVVGIAQRRGRAGARFQCAALRRWEPDALLALLALEPAQREAARRDLATVATGLPVAAGALVDALLGRLP